MPHDGTTDGVRSVSDWAVTISERPVFILYTDDGVGTTGTDTESPGRHSRYGYNVRA